MGPSKPLKLVFMGTPDLAATILLRLLSWEDGAVTAVYCQPDRPSGRGMQRKPPPTKLVADARGIPVFQPASFKDTEAIEQLQALAPDYLLVAAYGLLLPQRVLDIPRKMPLNVHTSLLPLYRGAAPIQWAIMHGDTETGVTIMRMDTGLDTGPILAQETISIGANETSGQLHDRIAGLGGDVLIRTLKGLEAGLVTETAQNEAKATHAPKLRKTDGYLNFLQPGKVIHAQMRGVTPWPGAYALLGLADGRTISLAVTEGCPIADGSLSGSLSSFLGCAPGTVLPELVGGALAVRCLDGYYCIASVQPAGRAVMDARSFMNGYLKMNGPAHFLPFSE